MLYGYNVLKNMLSLECKTSLLWDKRDIALKANRYQGILLMLASCVSFILLDCISFKQCHIFPEFSKSLILTCSMYCLIF